MPTCLCRACAAHYNLRDWKQALRFADAAIAANPETAWGHALRSQILVVRGKGREAVKAAEEAVRLAPHHAEYLRPLFSAYVSCRRMPRRGKRSASPARTAPGTALLL